MILCAAVILANQLGNKGFALEADRLTKKTIAVFYDPVDKIWKPPVATSESLGTQGYTFWSSLLAWQAIIEAAKVQPKSWKPKVGPFFDALEQYYDKGSHAYCAWKYFPGNDDHFYDDNGWAAVACMEAYEVTQEPRYKARAIEIFDKFVRAGWDDSDKPGGEKWGTKAGIPDREDRTVSATAGSALAGLLIAKATSKHEYRDWSKRGLDWIRDKLSTKEGLIYDGFKSPGLDRMQTIWTYNTGVPIRAAVEYSRQTGDKSYLRWAVKMGDAALDRNLSPLYDGAVKDHAKRFWFDGDYFVQYLVDGLRTLTSATHDGKYLAEARREAGYCTRYLKDSDGLYWRNMRLWTIDSTRLKAFRALTGQDSPPLAADSSERSQEAADLKKPVEARPLVKTLLGNAGTARMFWLLAH